MTDAEEKEHEKKSSCLPEGNGHYRTAEDRILEAIIAVVMVITLILTIYPFYYILVISFNDGSDAMRGGIYFFPRVFTLDNYSKFLNDTKWISAIGISVSRTLIGTIVTVFFTCLVAYAMSFRDLALRKTYYGLMLFCMYFSGGLVPAFLLMRGLNLVNTWLAIPLSGAVSATNLIIARTFFASGVPIELEEAAEIDGCGTVQTFLRVVLPLSKAMLSVILLYYAVARWNNYTSALYYLPMAPEKYPLQMVLRQLLVTMQETAIAESSELAAYYANLANQIKYAVIVIASLPLLVVYPFLQKYFEKGVMLGSVKG